MYKVEEHSFIQSIISEYKNAFAQDWIKGLDWSPNNESSSYTEGKRRIDDFSEVAFVTFSKSIIAGDYLTQPMDRLMFELKEFIDLCTDELLPATQNKLYSQLQSHFINLNHNMVDLSNYYRLMINELSEKLQVTDNVLIINAFSNKSVNYSNKLYEALDIILEVCFDEFSLSYNEKNIRSLIFKRDKLNEIKSSQSKDEIKNILGIVSEKIEYLLVKYSSISSNKNLKYSLNFTQITIKLDDSESHFTSHKRYGYYLNPYEVPKNVIREWQNNCYNGNAKVWEMTLLMKYYAKVEKNESQINNLIKQFDNFVKKQKNNKNSLFDSYALNTITNYMHNCRYSFLISTKEISFERLVEEIEKIKYIQSLTGIKNYHPYKKTVEFLKEYIRKEITSKTDISLIVEHKKLYDKILAKLQDTYQWCKKNQFYSFQLCYDECLDRITDFGILVFTPSSFCRPINYMELDEDIERYRSDAMTIDSEILLYKEELEILEIKKSIDKNKKSYIEILGIFTGLVTFLIGSITIFTNTEDPLVPLFEKIEHITLLGIIVLLFINGGYFLTSEVNHKSLKFWFFLITSILYIAILVKTYVIQ